MLYKKRCELNCVGDKYYVIGGMCKDIKVELPKVRVATGLYSNWDSFVEINEKILKWIENSRKTKPKDEVLKSKQEIFYTLNKAKEKGGEEFLISKKMYSWLDNLFKNRKKRLGGNGNNMGRTLCEWGLRPLVSYPYRSEKLMKASPNFLVATSEGLKSSKDVIKKNDPDFDHIVFKFKKGRHILSYDPMSNNGVFDYDFLRFASSNKFIDILILGYAHLLLPKYKKKTDEIIEYLSDHRPKVHLEIGSGSKVSMKYAIKNFIDNNCCDSLGLDEKECIEYFGSDSEDLKDLTDAVLDAIQEYGVTRICLHTPRFALSFSKLGLNKEFNSLIAACFVSAVKSFGKVNFNRVKKLLVENIKPKKEKVGRYSYCLVPAIKNPNPDIMTGLGDAFTAIQVVKSLS